MIRLYTDGATSSNGKADAIGGYAWILLKDDEVIGTGYDKVEKATNNICELLAMIKGCERALEILGAIDDITVFSDSAYCINCKNQSWYKKWQISDWRNSKKDPIANRALWERLIPFFEDPRFKFVKVKGHSLDGSFDSYWNNQVDALAQKAKTKI